MHSALWTYLSAQAVTGRYALSLPPMLLSLAHARTLVSSACACCGSTYYSPGNHRSARIGTPSRCLLRWINLAHARTLASAQCMLDPLASSVNHRSARIGTAPLATCYASLALCMPAPWPVHSACWSYLPAQVSTAVRGLVRLSRHLLYARLTFCMPAPWPVHSACWIYLY